MQCEPGEPDEPGGFTGPRMGPGTYASLQSLVPYKVFQGDKNAARPPEGSLVEARSLKGLKSAIVPLRSPNGLQRASRDLRISCHRSLVYIKGTQHHYLRARK